MQSELLELDCTEREHQFVFSGAVTGYVYIILCYSHRKPVLRSHRYYRLFYGAVIALIVNTGAVTDQWIWRRQGYGLV